MTKVVPLIFSLNAIQELLVVDPWMRIGALLQILSFSL